MVAALAAQTAPFVFIRPPEQSWSGWGLVAVLLTSLPVALRRRRPVVLWLLFSTLGIAVYEFAGSVPPQPIWYGPLICMYTVAHLSPLWHRLGALAGTVLGMSLVINSPNTAIREAATWSTAFALGALTRARQEAAAAAQRQAGELAAERERTRIARDLHDILGHAFSLMIVQAETGGALAKHDPERAEKAFDAIAETGRDAMAQLRGTVGSLRTAPRQPQPGLAEVAELVNRTRDTGLKVEVTTRGEPVQLPPDRQLAAYRVVQEALTNVVRHARASTATVLLDWRPNELEVSIVDDGVGAPALKKGNGLTGIRERVAAAGGEVEFTSTATGFRVAATFRT